MRWDVFCRVVDNHGDLGVCWRLAADLAGRGESVRLRVDNASALAWMAPEGAPGVTVLPFADDGSAAGDVVVETFGCDPPPTFIARMAASRPPVWINLEHLSAEAWVEHCHGLPSPVLAGPGAGLTKWFYFPGFTARTGGLLREPGLMAGRAAGAAAPGKGASILCYGGAARPPLEALAAAWPGKLRLAPGAAQTLVAPNARPAPWCTQGEFDRVLCGSALNMVRGEDSPVRAMWSGAPFVWQLYPQTDGAHLRKLEAFLDRFLDSAEPELGAALRLLWRRWNGALDGAGPLALPEPRAWGACCRRWRTQLLAQDDLVTQLLRFVAARTL